MITEKRYIVEEEFEYEGYKCVVTSQRRGHRCGYVGIPPGHPASGLDYTSDILSEIWVHGGLTYASGGNGYPVEGNYWWLGFDCAHYRDRPDMEAVFDSFELSENEIEMLRRFDGWTFPEGEVRSKEYVKEECMCLASQLKLIEKAANLRQAILEQINPTESKGA